MLDCVLNLVPGFKVCQDRVIKGLRKEEHDRVTGVSQDVAELSNSLFVKEVVGMLMSDNLSKTLLIFEEGHRVRQIDAVV